MPSIYQDGEYDISGTIIGIVEKDKIVNGKKIKPGDVMIGLPSNGLHTNGYSLARAVLIPKFPIDEKIDELGKSVGEALLDIHKSYLNTVLPLVDDGILNGISHITGGGIVGNTSRILPEGTAMNINWDCWNIPPIFKLIQKTGEITDDEMRHVFNMGIGMILIVSKDKADEVMQRCAHEKPVIMGEIVA